MIDGNIEKIGKYAFYNCTRITSLTIPDSIKAIGRETFSGCYAMEKVTAITLADGVATTYLGEYSDNGDVVFNVEGSTDSIKVFVWESLETLKPLVKAETVK